MTPTIDTIIAEMREPDVRTDDAHHGAGEPAFSAEKIAELADKLAALPAPGEWLPIESVPRDGTWVLLFDDDCLYSHASYLMARWEAGRWWGQSTNSGRSIIWHEATHWQPLPAAPLAAAQGEK